MPTLRINLVSLRPSLCCDYSFVLGSSIGAFPPNFCVVISQLPRLLLVFFIACHALSHLRFVFATKCFRSRYRGNFVETGTNGTINPWNKELPDALPVCAEWLLRTMPKLTLQIETECSWGEYMGSGKEAFSSHLDALFAFLDIAVTLFLIVSKRSYFVLVCFTITVNLSSRRQISSSLRLLPVIQIAPAKPNDAYLRSIRVHGIMVTRWHTHTKIRKGYYPLIQNSTIIEPNMTTQSRVPLW